ncbi:MAG: hypothetical protein HGA86_07660, partial [Anaerolineaceae bacterium]|nr:hypothetical protein [Anaerolineaceae bacterium]
MRIIGFAGTAKNTGKTTAALTLLELARTAGLTPALTSIGFDGESLDHVTGLPKPRYLLHPGDLLATAETCLAHSSARFEVLQETDIHTILG